MRHLAQVISERQWLMLIVNNRHKGSWTCSGRGVEERSEWVCDLLLGICISETLRCGATSSFGVAVHVTGFNPL